MIKRDLFGHPLKAKPPYLAPTLQRSDKRTFQERLERLQYLQTIFPKGYSFLLPAESALILTEVKMCFINGQFIATLMLTQSGWCMPLCGLRGPAISPSDRP